MTNKTWEFTLEDGPHKVEFWFSRLTGREKLVVDGLQLSNKLVWLAKSQYSFEIAGRPCQLVLTQAGTMDPSKIDLNIGGTPVDELPSNALLRPASYPTRPGDTLLRPAGNAGETNADRLLRPAPEEEAH